MEEKTRQAFLKMRWGQLMLVVVLWLPAAAGVTLAGHVYQDVYVALSPDLPESECEATVAGVEALLNETSALLFAVSGYRVYFPSTVHVVIPSSYTGCGTYSSTAAPLGYSYLQAPLRIDRNHSLFGAAFWTQQPRQCGQEGDFISFAPGSFTNDTLAARQLVKEWAKFRWGIMDEVGHEGDYVFPLAYPTPEGTYSPTVCVDTPLTLSESDCTSEQQCFYDAQINDNQTSSLLSVPDLPNVTEMCTSSTHDSDVPTKQNALCSGLSADEVFGQHDDYQVSSLGSNFKVPAVTVTVSFENPVTSSVVMAVEYTTAMAEYSFEFEYVVDAICQSLRAFLQDGVDFGVMLFNDSTTSLVGATELLKLNSTTREYICSKLEELYENSNATATSRSLSLAISDAAKLLPSSGGSILLLTRPLASETQDAETVASKAGVNTVWPLLYPYEKEDTTWYDTLSALTGSDKVRSVSTSLNIASCQVIMREQLSQDLVEIISLNQNDQLQTLSSESCTIAGNTCSMSHTVDQSTTADTYLVSVYFSDTIRRITLGPSGLDCQALQYNSVQTSRTFSCSSLPETISVEVVMVDSVQAVYSDVVGKTTFNSSTSATSAGLPGGEGIFVWASNGLRELQFTSTSAPSVFAQVYVEGRQVLEASVTAVVTHLTSSSASPQTLNLTLSDTGAGADVTGNDGIYSSFISFSSGNNSDLSAVELSFDISASGPAFFMPNETVDPPITCCGSLLPLPALTSTPDFAFNTSARGKVTVPPPENLPPGRVTDLKASSISGGVRLTFTAPGADLDAGTVSSYLVNTAPSAGGVTTNHSVTSGIVTAGSTQVLEFSSDEVDCGILLSYVVTATDDLGATGDPSNVVKHELGCSSDDYLSAGAIVGIVIGVLILLLLILLIVYLACNWSRRDELPLWRCLTCDNSPQEKGKKKQTGVSELHNRPTSVQMIRSLDDLYTNSDKSNSGISNAGFEETPSAQPPVAKAKSSNQRKGSLTSYGSRTLEKFNMPYDLRDSTLQTTLPINKVGIPVPEQPNSFDPQSPYVASSRSSPSTAQLPIYPNYRSASGVFDAKPKQSESLPEYSTYNRSSPYSDQRPPSASSLATTKSNLNTLV